MKEPYIIEPKIKKPEDFIRYIMNYKKESTPIKETKTIKKRKIVL